ncbi:MAG TPA: electron transporter RnfD [Spirochaetaceae bacterium]|nr:electron transporter RnfD [Spirochaetaceae bacterium]
MSDRKFTISVSPHVHSKETTPQIMLWVCVALLPACAWGVYSFGFGAFSVLAASVTSCEVFEYLFSKILFRKSTLGDCSALVTGLLIGMNLSAGVPLYVPIIASLFAIGVAKMSFGGLGQNFINPALAGRLFVFFSFTAAMSFFPQHRAWKYYRGISYPASAPYANSISSASMAAASASSESISAESADSIQRGVDAVTSASPLASYKSNPLSKKFNNLQYMNEVGYPFTRFASDVHSKTGISPYVVDAFFGFKNGCIGEISGLLLLLGVAILIFKKLISHVIPVVYIGLYMLLEWVLGGLVYGQGLFAGEAVYSVLTGGVLLCAFFMATDMVTSPVTKQGHAMYAALLAVMTFLIRRFSALPEGVSIALMLANIATPTIDKYCKRRVFGVKK